MRHTHLVLDENFLDEATRVLGVKTHSAAVNLALAEMLRVKKVMELSSFFGNGVWEGDLSGMREDQPRKKLSSAGSKRAKN